MIGYHIEFLGIAGVLPLFSKRMLTSDEKGGDSKEGFCEELQ
jgi:hypothetical protein